MNPFSYAIVLCALLCFGGAAFGQNQASPDARVEISQKSIGLLISGTTGSGTLHFQGKTYPFSIKAVGVGGAGVAKMDIVGNVYNLKSVNDFPGEFASVRAGAAAGETGTTTLVLQNKSGVRMNLQSKTEGLALQLGADVITISFSK